MESYIDLFANIFDFNWGTEPGEISALEIPNYIFFTTFCEEMLLKIKRLSVRPAVRMCVQPFWKYKFGDGLYMC